MVRAPSVLLALAVLAASAPDVQAQVPPARYRHFVPGAGQPLKLAPSTRLELSIAGKDGRDIRFEAEADDSGSLSVEYTPWDQWPVVQARQRGRVTLPDRAFGVVQFVDADAGTLVREPFATWSGKLVDPQRYAANVASAFSPVCRAAEGPPQALAAGDRYAFEVSGTAQSLQATLTQGRFAEVSWFALPEGGGFAVSVAAGADPRATWSSLEALASRGAIARLERDPCMRFLPDGVAGEACVDDDREFAAVAVHVTGTIEGVLRDAQGQALTGDAALLFGPVTPTPFANPGPRPGDEKSPTLVRTGRDGTYRAPLGELAGALEVSAAQGCASRSTVVIADGPSTTTRDPPQTPGVVAPSTLAQSKPQPNEKVCGPDVTDYVLGSLQAMIEEFNRWSLQQQQANCDFLYGIEFDGAWEMTPFSPYAGGDLQQDPHVYFGRSFPDVCATPKWPCGKTVEFLGICIDVQIVNYVQWGAVNQMCGTQRRGAFTHILRNAGMNLLRGGLGTTPVYDGQSGMAQLGESFAADSGGLAQRKKLMEESMRTLLRLRPGMTKLEGFDCPRNCGTYVPDKQRTDKLDVMDWGFRWGPDWVQRRGSSLARP